MITKAANAGAVCSRAKRAGKLLLTAVCLWIASCTHPPAKPEPAPAPPSQVKVEVRPGGPVILTTSSAEFQILPSGYIQAWLLKGDQRLTLDQPQAGGSDLLVGEAKEVQFALDFGEAKVQDSLGKLGRGKRVEISARPPEGSGVHIQRTLRIEIFDDFPARSTRIRARKTSA